MNSKNLNNPVAIKYLNKNNNNIFFSHSAYVKKSFIQKKGVKMKNIQTSINYLKYKGRFQK